MKKLLNNWNRLSLVKRILIGLVIGIILALTIPEQASFVVIFGSLFVSALKAVAPLLVFFLVMGAISQHKAGHQSNMKTIITLYLVGTFLASVIGVVASFMFPVTLTMAAGVDSITPPGGVVDVLKSLLLNIVDNPVKALFNANYIGILAWAALVGFSLRSAADSTKTMIANFADALSHIVRLIIKIGRASCRETV